MRNDGLLNFIKYCIAHCTVYWYVNMIRAYYDIIITLSLVSRETVVCKTKTLTERSGVRSYWACFKLELCDNGPDDMVVREHTAVCITFTLESCHVLQVPNCCI